MSEELEIVIDCGNCALLRRNGKYAAAPHDGTGMFSIVQDGWGSLSEELLNLAMWSDVGPQHLEALSKYIDQRPLFAMIRSQHSPALCYVPVILHPGALKHQNLPEVLYIAHASEQPPPDPVRLS